MDTLQRFGCFTNSIIKSPLRKPPSLIPRQWKPTPTSSPSFWVLRTSLRPVSEILELDVLQSFVRERRLNGDFISKVSDMFWQREAMKFVDGEAALSDTSQQSDQVMANDVGGFLNSQEPRNGYQAHQQIKRPLLRHCRMTGKEERDCTFSNMKLIAGVGAYYLSSFTCSTIAKLKRELWLFSIGIGTACSGYCLIVLSLQAAVSYATGVLFSCLYLQLLYQHADNLSGEAVPQIFMQKKTKKIGIRSEDVRDLFERSIKGSGIALSSPRLVIPAAIYSLWILSHRYLSSDFFDFQIVPAMLGMLVYKAAALVQVYRDNEDLQFVFPETEEGSKGLDIFFGHCVHIF